MPQGKTTGTKDHSTLKQKLELRARMLQQIKDRGMKPSVLEMYGGTGAIYKRLYYPILSGSVFERDPQKVDLLAWQRPTWSVYQGDTPSLLMAGIGGHLRTTIVDCDPFGHPWDSLEAFFTSMSEGMREVPDFLWVVVNDGARQYLRRKASAIWSTPWIDEDLLAKYGNALELNYLEVARELLLRKAAMCGYVLDHFEGYYCGHVLQNTHYLARFVHGSK